MAQNNTANVSTGKGVAGGYFFTAPVGTTLPTNYTSTLDSAFVNCGFLTDEGITSSMDASADNFTDLNGDDIATANSSRTRTLGLQFAEMNEASLKEVFGQSNVTTADNMITVKHNNTEMPERSIVLELVLRDSRRWRRVIPKAKVTSWEDMSIVSTSLVTLPVSYTMYSDSSGEFIYDYIQQGPSGATGATGDE